MKLVASLLAAVLFLSIYLGTFTTNDLSHSFLLGGPANLYFDFYGFLLENLIPITSALIVMFGISITLVAAGGGDWRTYAEHLLWILAVALGLFSYVVPGILIWAVMAYYKGLASALLVFLGPVGSAVAATVPAVQSRFSAPVPLIDTSGFGAGQGVLETVFRFLFYRVSGRAVGLAFLIFFAILGALGVLSVVLWHFSPLLHLVVYLAVAIGLAYAVVRAVRNLGLGLPALPWVIASIALFVLMVGIADIAVSALSWIGAMAPRAVPGGLVGNLTPEQAMVLLSIFSGPIFGALFGQLLSERGWSMRRIAVAIATVILGFLMALTVLG